MAENEGKCKYEFCRLFSLDAFCVQKNKMLQLSLHRALALIAFFSGGGKLGNE